MSQNHYWCRVCVPNTVEEKPKGSDNYGTRLFDWSKAEQKRFQSINFPIVMRWPAAVLALSSKRWIFVVVTVERVYDEPLPNLHTLTPCAQHHQSQPVAAVVVTNAFTARETIEPEGGAQANSNSNVNSNNKSNGNSALCLVALVADRIETSD